MSYVAAPIPIVKSTGRPPASSRHRSCPLTPIPLQMPAHISRGYMAHTTSRRCTALPPRIGKCGKAPGWWTCYGRDAAVYFENIRRIGPVQFSVYSALSRVKYKKSVTTIGGSEDFYNCYRRS